MKKKWLVIFLLLLLGLALYFWLHRPQKSMPFKLPWNKETVVYGNKAYADEDVLLPSATADLPEQLLYRKAYVASYNKRTKNPNWVAWRLTAKHARGNLPRRGSPFHEDTDVPEPRAYNYDYKRSQWSRGHICPAGDNKWDPDAQYETFLMTNICPQDRELNSGVWNQIEISCRNWAEKYGEVYIVSGPIFNDTHYRTIGENRVAIPDAFFKVVMRLGDKPCGIGFICKNANVGGKKAAYVKTISEVEQATGLTFFPTLSGDMARKVKSGANLKDW